MKTTTYPNSTPAPPQTALQLNIFLVNAGIALLVTAAFGMAFAALFSEAMVPGAGKMTLICGTGWIVLLGLSLSMKADDGHAYRSRLGRLMRNGVLFLVPITVYVLLFGARGALEIQLALVSVSFSFAYMLFTHIKDCIELGLSQRWTLYWFLSLMATAAAWFFVLCDFGKFETL